MCDQSRGYQTIRVYCGPSRSAAQAAADLAMLKRDYEHGDPHPRYPRTPRSPVQKFKKGRR